MMYNDSLWNADEVENYLENILERAEERKR